MCDTRNDFERIFRLTIRQATRHKDGRYRDPTIQAKWEGWRAREQLIPEMPKIITPS